MTIVAVGRGLMVSIDTKNYSESGFHFNVGRLLISASIRYIEQIEAGGLDISVLTLLDQTSL